MLPRQPYLYWCQRWEPHNKARLVSAHVLLSQKVWAYVLLGVGAEGQKRVVNYTYFIYTFSEASSWNLRRKWCVGFYEFKLHFVFYHLNITFWGLGQVVWINWIKTQSFAPGKSYFSPHGETTCIPPPQWNIPVFRVSQTLPARDCRVRFTKAGHSRTCRTLAQIHLREIFSRGTPPLSSGTPKSFLLVLLQGTVCQGNPLSPVQAEQGTSEPEEIHVHHKVLREKESHHRWMQISNPK